MKVINRKVNYFTIFCGIYIISSRNFLNKICSCYFGFLYALGHNNLKNLVFFQMIKISFSFIDLNTILIFAMKVFYCIPENIG